MIPCVARSGCCNSNLKPRAANLGWINTQVSSKTHSLPFSRSAPVDHRTESTFFSASSISSSCTSSFPVSNQYPIGVINVNSKSFFDYNLHTQQQIYSQISSRSFSSKQSHDHSQSRSQFQSQALPKELQSQDEECSEREPLLSQSEPHAQENNKNENLSEKKVSSATTWQDLKRLAKLAKPELPLLGMFFILFSFHRVLCHFNFFHVSY